MKFLQRDSDKRIGLQSEVGNKSLCLKIYLHFIFFHLEIVGKR